MSGDVHWCALRMCCGDNLVMMSGNFLFMSKIR